jgi:hypothetical protein
MSLFYFVSWKKESVSAGMLDNRCFWMANALQSHSRIAAQRRQRYGFLIHGMKNLLWVLGNSDKKCTFGDETILHIPVSD